MSYSFDFSDNPDSSGEVINLKRNDGPWSGVHTGFTMSYEFLRKLKSVRNFEVFEDDIWMTGYFGTRSPLMEGLVWLLNNNLDFATADKNLLSDRVCVFE